MNLLVQVTQLHQQGIKGDKMLKKEICFSHLLSIVIKDHLDIPSIGNRFVQKKVAHLIQCPDSSYKLFVLITISILHINNYSVLKIFLLPLNFHL